MFPQRVDWVPSVFRWLGRTFAALLFLFWGAFFLEHLSEWYLNAANGYPPLKIGVAMLFHATMLVGLALMLRWEQVGTGVLILGAVGFFGLIWDRDVLWLALVNLLPIVCFSIARHWRSGRRHLPQITGA